MICPTCRFPYDSLVCPTCTAKRSREGYLKQFREQLKTHILPGKLPLRLARSAMGREHIELSTVMQTLCGEAVTAKFRRSTVMFSPDVIRMGCCPRCREQFENLLQPP